MATSSASIGKVPALTIAGVSRLVYGAMASGSFGAALPIRVTGALRTGPTAHDFGPSGAALHVTGITTGRRQFGPGHWNIKLPDDEEYVLASLLNVEETIEHLERLANAPSEPVLSDVDSDPYEDVSAWEIVTRHVVDVDVQMVGQYLEDDFEAWTDDP